MQDKVFHEGERAVQERMGERAVALINGQNIGSAIPPAARGFIAQQQLAVLARQHAAGEVWIALLGTAAGAITASDDLHALNLSLPAGGDADAAVLAAMPALAGLRRDDQVGLLLIELATRRRLRVNGSIASLDDGVMRIAVEQGFANCPRYIQRRVPGEALPAKGPAEQSSGEALDPEIIRWIGAADTFFVGSVGPQGRLDASHRGGRPGFVQVRDGVLHIPDYPGNSHYNTLGNLTYNPRAGLVFVDFENGRQLQLTGETRIDYDVPDGDDNTDPTQGTHRWWTFRPQRWVIAPMNRPLHWQFVDASPFNP